MMKLWVLLVVIAAVGIQSATSRGLGEVIREKAHAQIIVKRDNGTSNDTIVEVFPEWHLLNPEGALNGTGMLLPVVGDTIGHSCGRLNLAQICREMGYQGLLDSTSAGAYFDQAYIDQFPVVVTDVISINNETRYYYDSNNTDCDDWQEYVFCDPGDQPTEAPEPVYELVFGALYQWEEGNAVPSNEGLAVVAVRDINTGEETWGTVCDDSFNNRSADIACQTMGFDYAVSWGNHRNYQYVPESEVANISIVMDQFYCPAGAQNLSDCSYDLMKHDCSHSEDIVLKCSAGDVNPTNDTEPEYEIVYGALYALQNGNWVQSNKGIAVLGVRDTRTGEETYGTVCDDSFSNRSADIACQAMGFDYAVSWGNNEDYRYVNRSLLANVSIVMDNFNCPAAAHNISDCSYDLMQHNCGHHEDILLHCSGGDVNPTNDTEPGYEIIYGGLREWNNDSFVRSNKGIAVLGVRDTRTGEVAYGTVCDDSFSNRSADIACQAMGFDYAVSWGNNENYRYVPEDVIANVSIVMDNFNCPATARDISDCSYDLMHHDCSHQEDILLHCSGGSDSPPTEVTWYPTEPTRGPTSYPLDDEIAVEFGGLEVQMDVNPKKGRAKIADVLEEIADILGY